MIVCSMPGCQTTAGCQCQNRAGVDGWFDQIKKDASIHSPLNACCYREQCKALEARALAAEAAFAAERAKTAKVLEPFDDALGEDDEGYGDGLTVVMKWGACTDYSVTLGDLRDVRRHAAAIRAEGE